MWMGIGGPQGQQGQEAQSMQTPFSRGGGITGFSNSPSQVAQAQAKGNEAWSTGHNAVNQTGQFSPQALAQGQAAGSNALSVQNAGQRAAQAGQTGQRPMGTPGTAEISTAGAPAPGTPPPVDQGPHRPNDQAREAQQEMVQDAPTIAPQGMYDPNFNMQESIRQQMYAGIRGNYIDGSNSPAPGMGSSFAVPSYNSPGDLFSGMGKPDLFGRPQNV